MNFSEHAPRRASACTARRNAALVLLLAPKLLRVPISYTDRLLSTATIHRVTACKYRFDGGHSFHALVPQWGSNEVMRLNSKRGADALRERTL
jgi:hypothetical protein